MPPRHDQVLSTIPNLPYPRRTRRVPQHNWNAFVARQRPGTCREIHQLEPSKPAPVYNKRPEIDIRNSLEPLTSNQISLHDQSGQKKDIVDYLNSVVYSDKNMRRWREEDKKVVIDVLSDRADGM